MNNKLNRLISLFLFSLMVITVDGERRFNDVYLQWNRLPSDSLFSLGQQYYEQEKLDSALICFTISGNKSESATTIKEKSTCVKSLILSARLYFIYYEYDKACDQLIRAIKLCDEEQMSENLTGIYMEQGALMMTYAQQRPKEDNFKQAEEAYRKAFWQAVKHQQYASAMTAFFNLGNRLYGTMRLDEMRDELAAFNQLNIPPTETSYHYIQNFYHALCNIANNDFAEARKYFHRQITDDLKEYRTNILKFQVYANLTKSFVLENNLDSAIYYEEKMFELASTNDMKDAKSLAASVLANLYAQQGDSLKSSEYSIIALQLKDSLLSVNNLDEVKSLNFIRQLHEEEAKVNQYKNKTTWLTIIQLTLFILLIIGGYLGYRLFKRHRMMKIKISRPTIKYENSTLEESVKQELKDKITHVLTDTGVIYNQDFCLSQLADMCNSKSKYVSQVINELYNQNFTSLINSLRIEEACRRMKDKETYGSWTLEGISQSVGFKSRVTFYNAFKKHAGMNPSEYAER